MHRSFLGQLSCLNFWLRFLWNETANFSGWGYNSCALLVHSFRELLRYSANTEPRRGKIFTSFNVCSEEVQDRIYGFPDLRSRQIFPPKFYLLVL